MGKRTVLLLTVVAAMLLAFSGVVLAQQDQSKGTTSDDPSQQSAQEGSVVPGQHIVVLKDRVTDPRSVAQEHTRRYGAQVTDVYEVALKGYAARLSERGLSSVSQDSRVESVEPVRLEKIVASQEYTSTTGANRTEEDHNPKANPGTDGAEVNVALDVAVLDTGVNKDHSDLEVKGGHNATDPTNNPNNWADGHGHGTHVAGTIGARGNGSGAIGVAPGANLYGVRVCDSSGSCPSNHIVGGIDWVAARKVEANQGKAGGFDFAAANMSISTQNDNTTCSSSSDAVHKAICGLTDKGVVFTLAAGNNGTKKAAYPEAMAVSALADFDGKAGKQGNITCRSDEDDTLANFSNWGPDIDIAAPGVCIYSTWKDGGYRTISGTSMAAPHVAGAVALYLHANGKSPATDDDPEKTPPDYTPSQGVTDIRDAILGAAKAQSDQCGYTNEKNKRGSKEKLLFVNTSSNFNSSSFGGTDYCEVAQR